MTEVIGFAEHSSRFGSIIANNRRTCYSAEMGEGRKRVLAIVAGILVARHLKTTDDLFDSRSSPRTESLVAAAVQWAERIMRRIDGAFPK
jgi:hypothetical protein